MLRLLVMLHERHNRALQQRISSHGNLKSILVSNEIPFFLQYYLQNIYFYNSLYIY